MLERIREGSQGPWAMIIVGLIVLSFVFAGVGSYLTSSGSNAAAVVNGTEISMSQLERAYQNQRGRMEAQFGEGVAALFGSEDYLQTFRRNVLDQLIAEELVSQKAQALGLRISDAQIKDTIVNMPEFQIDGVFNNERFLMLLRQNGFQANTFRDYLRVQMTREQLSAALQVSEFVLPTEASQAFSLQSQTRNGRFVTVAAKDFVEGIEVTDAEMNDYYQANIASFDTEEQVALEYALLDAEALLGDVAVTADEVQAYYDANIDLYRTEEERRVSHILFDLSDDADAARTQADEVLAKIQQGGDFAQLAEQYSVDTLSAEEGGDLGFIEPGSMDDAFDAAVFGLANVGDVTEVVETEFGLHIITVTEINAESVKQLADVQEDIETLLKAEKAEALFYEKQDLMARLAFEIADSLQDVANEVGVEVITTPLASQTTLPAIINTPAVVEAAFSDELIEEQLNSEVIDLGSNRAVVVRVVQHEAQRTQSFDEVKETIEASLIADKSTQAAEAWAADLVAKMDAGDDVSALLTERELEWQTVENVRRNDPVMPRNLNTELFRLSTDAGKNTASAALLNGDAGVVELATVNSGSEADEATLEQISQQLRGLSSRTTYESFVASLREGADIEVRI